MVDIVKEVQDKKNDLENDIKKIDKEIRELTDAYDSLLMFQKSASGAQTDFNQANSHRRTVLKDLSGIKNNPVVQNYRVNMGNQLTGVGMKVVDAAFVGLGAMISAKLLEYKARIELLCAQRKAKVTEYKALDIVT